MEKILEFCRQNNVPVSDRSCTGSYMWDGRTIALYRSDSEVEGKTPLHPADVVHEIAHFLVADPVEREFPDWGCNLFGFFGASGGYVYYREPEKFEGVLTKEEQQWREACADFLGCQLCRTLGVYLPLEAEASFKYGRGFGGYDTEIGRRAEAWVRKNFP